VAIRPREIKEPKVFKGTIHELLLELEKSASSWSDFDKSLFRAGWTGKLSGDKSERAQ
jgi:hypothetical protein